MTGFYDCGVIKERIHTINPTITDELLDLLYEYLVARYSNDIQENLKDCDLQGLLDCVSNPAKYVNKRD
jgi:hypothetical protein